MTGHSSGLVGAGTVELLGAGTGLEVSGAGELLDNGMGRELFDGDGPGCVDIAGGAVVASSLWAGAATLPASFGVFEGFEFTPESALVGASGSLASAGC
jgi:hypothetical protein